MKLLCCFCWWRFVICCTFLHPWSSALCCVYRETLAGSLECMRECVCACIVCVWGLRAHAATDSCENTSPHWPLQSDAWDAAHVVQPGEDEHRWAIWDQKLQRDPSPVSDDVLLLLCLFGYLLCNHWYIHCYRMNSIVLSPGSKFSIYCLPHIPWFHLCFPIYSTNSIHLKKPEQVNG